MKLNNRSEYQALAALNYSGAKELLKSPAHYQTWLAAPQKESAALRVGSAVHAAVLEPGHYAADFAVAPDVDRRTKEGKEKWAEFQTLHAGKTILTTDEAELVGAVSAQIVITMHRLSIKPVHHWEKSRIGTSVCNHPRSAAMRIGISNLAAWVRPASTMLFIRAGRDTAEPSTSMRNLRRS